MFTLTFILLSLLFPYSSLTAHLITLPPSDVVHASSGLILHYLNQYSPSNRIISFTVSFPMTIGMCYLMPLKVIQKIPYCHRSSSNSSHRSSYHSKQFLTDIISIGVGSATLVLPTANTIQVLNLKHEVRTLTESLFTLTNTSNIHTAQLLHLNEGQLKLTHELNNTQVALNRTIKLINDRSDVLHNLSDAIAKLATVFQVINNKRIAFHHSAQYHFLHTSLSDILVHNLNLHFIHQKDLPAVLDFITASANVSFNPNTTLLPLVDVVSQLILQQRIDFLPIKVLPDSRDPLIGVLSISSFFAATTSNQASFSLYELFPIPFPYRGLRVRLVDIPFIIGLDATSGRLIHWTKDESDTCDFRVMSVCRETPPIISNWNNTCLFQILTNASLSACRTEQYLEPIFIHRIGNHWAISTNSTHHCHSITLSEFDQSQILTNNMYTLSSVALITIPPNTKLVCDRFSISLLPNATGSSLTILNSSVLNTSYTDVFDLYFPLTNTTHWPKLPYISDHFQAVFDFIKKTSTPEPLHPIVTWYRHPFFFLNVIFVLISFGFLGFEIYYRLIRSTVVPRNHLELPTTIT